jgi:hypothetical protein
MSIAPILRPRVLVAFALALILSVSAYGFAAANTVVKTGAGDAAEEISGYAITNVIYTLDPTDPTKINDISFDVNPIVASGADATFVSFKLVNGSTTWIEMTKGTGNNWTHTFSPSITTASVDKLSVVAKSDSEP